MMTSAPVTARAVVLVIGVTLRHRQVARRQPDLAPAPPGRARARSQVVSRRSARAGAPCDLPARLVLSWIDAVREIAIAGGLITIGGGLVAVRARLVSLTARLITVGRHLLAPGQRLRAVSKRLIVTELPRSAGAAVTQSSDERLAITASKPARQRVPEIPAPIH
jgi:hypothetical protein